MLRAGEIHMRSSNVNTKRKEPTHSDVTQTTANGKRRRSNGGGGGAGKTGRPQPGLVHNASKTLGRFTLPFWGAPDGTRKTGQFMTKRICFGHALRRFANALTFGNKDKKRLQFTCFMLLMMMMTFQRRVKPTSAASVWALAASCRFTTSPRHGVRRQATSLWYALVQVAFRNSLC